MPTSQLAARRLPLTAQQADDILAVHGWTGADLYELVRAFARKVSPKNALKYREGRVVVWIKRVR